MPQAYKTFGAPISSTRADCFMAWMKRQTTEALLTERRNFCAGSQWKSNIIGEELRRRALGTTEIGENQ